MTGFLARNLVQRPYATNMVLAGLVMGVGDAAAQQIESKSTSFSLHAHRSLTMTSYSTFFMAPFCVVVYSFVNKRIPGNNLRTAIKRGISSNFLMNPIGNVWFFTYSTVLEKYLADKDNFHLASTLKKSQEKVKEELGHTIVASALFWIPLNVANFHLVPPQGRVVVAFGIAAIWNCYLSLIQHKSHKSTEN